MAKVTAVDQLQKLVEVAREHFAPERFSKVEAMIEYFAERLLVAPASGKVHFHNCYPGGYLDHVHNVITGVIHVGRAAKAMGMQMDFTREEAVFAAMHHDLGKVGDLTEPYYLPQQSDWHRVNRGEMYVHNPKLPYMLVPDRALHLLQHFNIAVTDKEWKAIKASDGLYAEGNKSYFISYGFPPPPFHTNLHYIVHFADMLATRGEADSQRLAG